MLVARGGQLAAAVAAVAAAAGAAGALHAELGVTAIDPTGSTEAGAAAGAARDACSGFVSLAGELLRVGRRPHFHCTRCRARPSLGGVPRRPHAVSPSHRVRGL